MSPTSSIGPIQTQYLLRCLLELLVLQHTDRVMKYRLYKLLSNILPQQVRKEGACAKDIDRFY